MPPEAQRVALFAAAFVSAAGDTGKEASLTPARPQSRQKRGQTCAETVQKGGGRNTVAEAQAHHQGLEQELPRADPLDFQIPGSTTALQIAAQRLRIGQAQHLPLAAGQGRHRTRADPQVRLETPVAQIVSALPTRAGEAGDLVVPVAPGLEQAAAPEPQPLLRPRINRPSQGVLRVVQGQRVQRDVVWRAFEGLLDVLPQARPVLARDPRHQVQVDLSRPAAGQESQRRRCFAGPAGPAQGRQNTGLEALDPDAQARHPPTLANLQVLPAQRLRVGLYRPLTGLRGRYGVIPEGHKGDEVPDVP